MSSGDDSSTTFETLRGRNFPAIRQFTIFLENRVGQLLARNDSSAYNYLPDSVGEFPCYEALAERMVAAGLSTAKLRSASCKRCRPIKTAPYFA